MRLQSRFGKILKEASLPHIRFQALRHSAATILLSMGPEGGTQPLAFIVVRSCSFHAQRVSILSILDHYFSRPYFVFAISFAIKVPSVSLALKRG